MSTARINRALIPPLCASKRNQLAAVAGKHFLREKPLASSLAEVAARENKVVIAEAFMYRHRP